MDAEDRGQATPEGPTGAQAALIAAICAVPAIAHRYVRSADPSLYVVANTAMEQFRAAGQWKPTPPTAWSYWVTPDLLAGKYPGDLSKTTAAVKLTQLVSAGVTRFVDLTGEGELRSYEQLLHRFFPDVDYIRVPMPGGETIDAESMAAALSAIEDHFGLVYVHCRGGCGRTGQVVGCYLIEEGANPPAALETVQRITRPMWQQRGEDCPQTPEQKRAILRWQPKRARLGSAAPTVTVAHADPKIRGCMLGGAIGAAIGADPRSAAISANGDPDAPTQLTVPVGQVLRSTADTQMTLFTAEGLLRTVNRGYAKGIGPAMDAVVDHAYARWLTTQDITATRWSKWWDEHKVPPGPDGWLITVEDLHHRRSPDPVSLDALQTPDLGTVERPPNDSRGSAAVARITPVGLLASTMVLLGSDYRALAAFQHAVAIAAITHGHPSGYLPAGVLAAVVEEIVWHGQRLEIALERAERILLEQPGHEETFSALQAARRLAAERRPGPAEAVALLGRGDTGPEALAIGIYAALVSDSFASGVLIAVNHSGSRARTGAIAGSLLGAIHGNGALPTGWLDALELRSTVGALLDDWIAFATDADRFVFGDNDVDPGWWDRYPGW